MPARAPALSVNLNKVALLRNAREIDVPSLQQAAHIALAAGSAGLTVHPRPDGRHVRADDVPDIARIVAKYARREYNIEGNPFAETWTADAREDYPGFMALVQRAAAAGAVHQVTLVPDEPGQATSDHGWNLQESADALQPAIAHLKTLGSRVSLFVDPVPEMMAIAARIGADRVELYTEPYARAFDRGEADGMLTRYEEAAAAAARTGLEVNAGHDLNLANLGPFIRRVPMVCEVSIGHALTADALWMGLGEAVRAYLQVLDEARSE